MTSTLRIRAIVARILAGYRHDWRPLLVAGLLIFVPLGLISAIDPFEGTELADSEDGLEGVLFGLLQGLIPLIGIVLYAGAVAAAEENRHGRERGTLREILAGTPIWTLLLADLAYIGVLFGGFVLLIVPGFVFMTWFAVIAPVIEAEGLGVRAAFRRSRELVRPHAWKVAAVVIPLTILQSTLEALGEEIGLDALGEGFLGEWAGAVASDLLSSPLYALAVLAIYREMRVLEGS